MKILSLKAANVKRISVVEITPDGALVEITGKNRQGKTSVLDALWWGLEGAEHIQTSPIRGDAEKATIQIDLGTEGKVDYIVTRTMRRRPDAGPGERSFTTSLTVSTAEGARFTSPQTILDNLIGSIAFDPLAFMSSTPKEQFETLRAFVPGVDFAKIDALNKTDFESRTAAGRVLKTLAGQLAGVPAVEGAPDVEVDEEPLLQRLQSAADHNSRIRDEDADRHESRRARARKVDERARREARIKMLRDEADAMELTLVELDAEIVAEAQAAEQLPALADPIDTADVRAQIDAARQANLLFRQAERRRSIEAEIVTTEADRTRLTKAMEDRKARVDKLIAAADLPVTGLAFGDGFLTLNGQPMEQASDAEQLELSVAVAAKLNPKLRVIRVREGSRMDSDAMSRLANYAQVNDLQVWVETVDSQRAGAVVLEDGMVKGAPQPNPPAVEEVTDDLPLLAAGPVVAPAPKPRRKPSDVRRG